MHELSLACAMPLVRVLDYDWGGIQCSSGYKTRKSYSPYISGLWEEREAWASAAHQKLHPQIVSFIADKTDPCAKFFLFFATSDSERM